MEQYRALEVSIDSRKVGTLATYKERFTAFEYADEWLRDGFAISPFSLPLQKKVYLPRVDPFDGLFGVFADSLPDGWGRLLVGEHATCVNGNGRDPQIKIERTDG